MAYHSIIFNNFWSNNIPTRRRTAKRLARGYVYMKPLQWLRNTFFDQYYLQNEFYDAYDPATTYVAGNQVVYFNATFSLYEVKPGATPAAGTLPTNTTYWIKISDNWVGFKYRQQATCEKKKLEYLLNLFFATTLNSPPTLPDIRIVNNSGTGNEFFLSAINESGSDNAVLLNGQAVGFVGSANPVYDVNNFTIEIPSAVYAAIAGTNTERDAIIKAQVDSRIIAGTQYNITTY